MISLPKVVGVMSCGFLLCLGLSTAAQADNAASTADRLKADQSDRRQGGQEAGEKQMRGYGGRPVKQAARRSRAKCCALKAMTVSSRGRTAKRCGCISTSPP